MKTIAVIGSKNSGKTTLVSKLVNYFSSQSIKVGVIKHAHHSFEIDHPNTDSYKIRKSGAYKTTIISDKRLAFIEERVNENEIDLMFFWFPPSQKMKLYVQTRCSQHQMVLQTQIDRDMISRDTSNLFHLQQQVS